MGGHAHGQNTETRTSNQQIKIIHTQLIGNQNQQSKHNMNNLEKKKTTKNHMRCILNAFDLIALICWHELCRRVVDYS